MVNRSLLVFILFLCIPLSARQRSNPEMMRLARMALSPTATRSEAPELKLLDESEGFAIYGDAQSFAIISKDDCFKPVWGYSLTPYDKTAMPCGFQWWLSAVETVMKAGAVTDLTEEETPVVVEPLLKTTWGQNDPYNTLCPFFSGRKGVTGCAATALSQVLNYYRYPAVSNGRGYYTLGANASPMYVNIQSEYQWDLMKNNYASAWFLSADEKNAIGQLMYDAGVACHMNYASDGSATTIYEAGNALSQVFQYDSLAIQCVSRSYCEDDAAWMRILREELVNGHPLLMGAQSPSGGHAFVIDGLDADGKIHVNWGWDGKFDGYYEFTNLNPSSYHFDYDQTILTGLRLDPTPTADEVYRSCWVLSDEDDLRPDMLNGLTLVVGDGNGVVMQNSHLTFYGKVGLVFQDEAGNEVFFKTFFDTSDKANYYAPVPGGLGYYISYFNKVTVADLAEVPAGKYRVFLASKAEQDLQPQVVCYPGGNHHEYWLTKAEDNTLTVAPAEPTAIHPIVSTRQTDTAPYSLQGYKLGISTDNLPRGIYIIGGKKVVK